MVYKTIDSPLGTMTLQANEQGLTGIWFETQTSQPTLLGRCNKDDELLCATELALQAYFSGQKNAFANIPLAATGSEFQMAVWHALTNIAYGQTCSYEDLAIAVGNPKAVRAVGLANGKNPLSILVPCHRVIGKNGKLTGYAGGIERKAWLLKHEGVEIE